MSALLPWFTGGSLYLQLKCRAHISRTAFSLIHLPPPSNSEDLTEVLEAITNEPDMAKGLQFYQTPSSNDFSLESIGASSTSTILDQKTNPLYSIYMYAYWRSDNGNGHNDINVAREDMMFLSDPVDYYGHTIITDEFEKKSGYNPALTAETIRVTNMWMATVQSLYEGVELCHVGPDDIDELTYINPIDKAAAFWIGTHDDVTSSEGGSLYAWANKLNLSGGTGFVPNDEIVDGLILLQSTLKSCLDGWDATITDEQEYEMKKTVGTVIRAMTAPLVESLVSYASKVAGATEPDAEMDDYMIVSRCLELGHVLRLLKSSPYTPFSTKSALCIGHVASNQYL